MREVVVTAHQVNLLPGLSVISKIASADIYIACDMFASVRHGWFNRNRMADGTPLTVPLDHSTWGGYIRDVLIGKDARWQRKLSKTLELKLGEPAAPYVEIIRRPYRRIVALNAGLLGQLCRDLSIRAEWIWQSHLEAGQHNPLRAHSEHPDDLRPVSDRLAAMVAEVGGTTWLSGSSGRGYLNHEPFDELGISVRYFDHDGPNPSAIELLRDPTPNHTRTAEAIATVLASRVREEA